MEDVDGRHPGTCSVEERVGVKGTDILPLFNHGEGSSGLKGTGVIGVTDKRGVGEPGGDW